MGMDFSFYVGPYISVKKDSGFDWLPWESLVRDGRGEWSVCEYEWILIPNRRLQLTLGGSTRALVFSCGYEMQLEQINPAMIVRESSAFSRELKELISFLDDRDIDYVQAWGVVPCCMG